jgi:hypothetical protein
MAEKISLKKCKDILNKKGDKYSDEEIIAIRDYLYDMAQIDYEIFIYNQNKEGLRKIEDEKIKVLNENIIEEDETHKNAA